MKNLSQKGPKDHSLGIGNFMDKRTFADKFSRFKTRFLALFWTGAIGLFLYTFWPFLSSLYSITQTNNSYFQITYQNKEVSYQRTKEKPVDWVPLEKISKRAQSAIIVSEDGTFYDHPGYDSEQLNDVINDYFKHKKKLRGASTITQQLMKNLYLNKKKTLGRKAQELFMSLMVERYSNKKKILEMYLNVIEYGEGLYGIGPAAKFYFNKTPDKINAREAAFLAMLLPSPKRYSRSFKNKMLSAYASRAVSSILLRMRQAGTIGEDEFLEQSGSLMAWERTNEALTASSSASDIDQEMLEGQKENDEEEI